MCYRCKDTGYILTDKGVDPCGCQKDGMAKLIRQLINIPEGLIRDSWRMNNLTQRDIVRAAMFVNTYIPSHETDKKKPLSRTILLIGSKGYGKTFFAVYNIMLALVEKMIKDNSFTNYGSLGFYYNAGGKQLVEIPQEREILINIKTRCVEVMIWDNLIPESVIKNPYLLTPSDEESISIVSFLMPRINDNKTTIIITDTDKPEETRDKWQDAFRVECMKTNCAMMESEMFIMGKD